MKIAEISVEYRKGPQGREGGQTEPWTVEWTKPNSLM